jgi:hypothetical protein
MKLLSTVPRAPVAFVLACAVWLVAPTENATAATTEDGYRLYFGDLHNHTRFSDGWAGTPEDAFAHAREAGADWLSTSDHNFLLTQEEWRTTKRMADRQTSDNFVAMAGSEYWIANGFGEVIVNNVEELRTKANFRGPGANLSRAEVVPAFYDWLASHRGAIGHWPHPGLYGDLDEFDHYTPFRDRAMSSIEIHNYGSWLGAPARWGVHDYEPDYVTALDKGWHIMPAAVSDTHSPDWISGSPVRTVLLAKRLTRGALYGAMRASRGYATLDENLRVHYSVNGKVMGSILEPSATAYQVHVRAEDPDGARRDAITRLEIVSDHGRVVASTETSGADVAWTTTLRSATARYFYVRVTTASDVSGREGLTAWTAPVWTGR